jgi:hypothetical protein
MMIECKDTLSIIGLYISFAGEIDRYIHTCIRHARTNRMMDFQSTDQIRANVQSRISLILLSSSIPATSINKSAQRY